MKRVPSAALGLIAAFGLMNFVSVGCGSEDAAIDETSDAGGGNEVVLDAIAPGSDSTVDSTQRSTSDAGVADAPVDAFVDAITDGGRDPDAQVCKLEAAACTKSTDCCSANCNALTLHCEKPIGSCKLAGIACAAGPDCCSSSCIGGVCSSKQCVADNAACGSNAECCGSSCAPDGLGGGKCAALNATCKTAGNPCGAASDCCSKACNNGVCTETSFCTQNGDVCSSSVQCCGGACTIAPGKTAGLCGITAATGAGGCDVAGTLCTSSGSSCGGNCCSRSCAPYGVTQTSVCQPASGCHVTGDLCRGDSDCCGWSGSPDPKKGFVTCRKDVSTQEFGLCDKGEACTEPGTICGKPAGGGVCNASNGCCDPVGYASNYCQNNPEKCCARDSLGVPRCTIKPLDCVGARPAAGTVCATSADCCGAPCVNNLCGAQGSCVPSGNGCTANADCCAGTTCAIPTGSTKGVCGGTTLADGGVSTTDGGGAVTTTDGGTAGDGGVCALYGQSCAQASDCCSKVPCTSGTCHFP